MLFRSFLLSLCLATSLFAQDKPEWKLPFPPHRIAGNVYYVGGKDLASYLITTPEGHMLINSNLESSVPQIKESIEKLGFHFKDIKILLISHAHYDHCAGSALIKQLTGAKYMVMGADVPEIEDGGHSNFRYRDSPEMFYKPTKVDRILHDGDEVRLGDVVLTAHLTPGHTKGCTTWTLQVKENEKTYNVVIVGSPNVNPGYKLIDGPQYPQIAQDYERTFQTLKALPCDIFLGAHGGYYGMEEKFARIGKTGNPFLDPAGYKAYVADREQAFRTELSRQKQENPQK
jgi:metallo-beta-lactamase class B